MNSIIKSKKTYYILGIILIFLIWFLAEIVIDNSYIIPKLSDTFVALKNLLIAKNTYKVFGFTLLRLFLSVFVCFILALLLGILSILSEKFRSFIQPSITLFKTLPIAVVIIMLLVFFGRENAPYFIVGVVILPIIYQGILQGYESINDQVKMEVKLNMKRPIYVVLKIYLPLIVPHIISSLIQSVGLGLKVLVMAEYISQPKYSIGNELVYYKDIAIDMSYVYAWSIILILFILLIDLLLNLIKKKIDIN